jgi:hypothetical protein
MYLITIKSAEWSMDEMRKVWAGEDETLTPAQVDACADTEYAHLVTSAGEIGSGWTYSDGAFTGPATADAINKIMELLVAASDYVLSVLDEIKAETPEPATDAEPTSCVYHRDQPDACEMRFGGSPVLYRVSDDVWCSGALAAFTAEMGAGDPAVRGAVRIV